MPNLKVIKGVVHDATHEYLTGDVFACNDPATVNMLLNGFPKICEMAEDQGKPAVKEFDPLTSSMRAVKKMLKELDINTAGLSDEEQRTMLAEHLSGAGGEGSGGGNPDDDPDGKDDDSDNGDDDPDGDDGPNTGE